jgi:hypothetical protein
MGDSLKDNRSIFRTKKKAGDKLLRKPQSLLGRTGRELLENLVLTFQKLNYNA